MTQTEEERKKDKELEAGESQVVSEKSLLRHSFFYKKIVLLHFQKLPYPKSVFFIVGNEFCERFSYYGMKGKSTKVLN